MHGGVIPLSGAVILLTRPAVGPLRPGLDFLPLAEYDSGVAQSTGPTQSSTQPLIVEEDHMYDTQPTTMPGEIPAGGRCLMCGPGDLVALLWSERWKVSTFERSNFPTYQRSNRPALRPTRAYRSIDARTPNTQVLRWPIRPQPARRPWGAGTGLRRD